VCLVSLADYFNFISDDQGRMRAEIFQDNVRDYEGANTVNRAISETLRAGDGVATDFWWLNNGVTIIGRRVQTSNKKLVIDDPQIFNGLQTSRNVYEHFSTPHDPAGVGGSKNSASSRCLLVRVVQADDDAIAAEIIKATNSQTRIPPSALRATEPFQKDFEEFFSSRGLFSERRKNEYRNQGRQRRQIVAISELPKPLPPSSSTSHIPHVVSRPRLSKVVFMRKSSTRKRLLRPSRCAYGSSGESMNFSQARPLRRIG
jgi:AIPR protein